MQAPLPPKNLLSVPKPEVDQHYLYDFLVTRSMVFTKLNKPQEALDDIDKALRVAQIMEDEYIQKSHQAVALLQKGYVMFTVANEPMEGMLVQFMLLLLQLFLFFFLISSPSLSPSCKALNHSLSLNPCANMDGETHALLTMAIRENEYYDSDEWRHHINMINDDYSDYGVERCAVFLQSVSKQADERDNRKQLSVQEVGSFVAAVNIHWMLYNCYEALHEKQIAFAHLTHAHNIDKRRMEASIKQHEKHSLRQKVDILNIYSKQYWREQSKGSYSKLPVFIVGFFRSGSTLLESMLTQHKHIATLGIPDNHTL